MRSRLTLSTPAPTDGEPADLDARTLTRFKSNFARRDEKIDVRWTDGVLIAESPPTGIFGTIERRTAERVFLDLLDKTTAQDIAVSVNSRSGNYAPRIFLKYPDRDRFTTADLERAMHRLLSAGDIRNVVYGRKNDERRRLARAEAAA